MKLKAAASTPATQLYYVVNQILYALVQGCESKDVKIIKVCFIVTFIRCFFFSVRSVQFCCWSRLNIRYS